MKEKMYWRASKLKRDEMMQPSIVKSIRKFKLELDDEFDSILGYWYQNIRNGKGGFYGSISNQNIPDRNASIGIVMVSRILWTFSAAYSYGKTGYEEMPATAYRLITDRFTDKEYSGVYWSINPDGCPLEQKKQIYGLAFCIYGLSEYYRISGQQEVLDKAIELYLLIEKYSFDPVRGGYIEALNRDWQEVADLRLSDKDLNTQKSMNTHLHIVEAYANLYSVWKDAGLKKQIRRLLDIFDKNIIDPATGHMHLFMDKDWKIQSDKWSFGHDIEASWLLLDCAKAIECSESTGRFRKRAIDLATSASEGIDVDGGLFYEFDVGKNILVKEKHWWPQAEAMVGFFKLWKMTGDDPWLEKSLRIWDFIKENLKDHRKGEWYWGKDSRGALMAKEKAGFWKCPYHNGRACMEVIQSINE